jgi:hypothetical protein
MTDEYLWDRTGPPDPDVQRLETLASRYRHRGALSPSDLPHRVPQMPVDRGGFSLRVAAIAIAATVLLVILPAGWILSVGAAGWRVTTVAGAPHIGGVAVPDAGRLTAGEWLITDDRSRATIQIGRIGEVTVEPGSRLQMVRGRLTDQRLLLRRGGIQARITAPPRIFSVETPSATAVDLGCIYSLRVADDGTGTLRVQGGWVAFEVNGIESFVPANGICITRPRTGPGTPHYEDAPAALRAALTRFDTADDARVRAEALGEALEAARVRDAFTVWHLLSRTEGGDRADVFARLSRLVPPPESVTVEGILEGDRAMLDAWWNALGLDEAWWWRIWKGPVPSR